MKHNLSGVWKAYVMQTMKGQSSPVDTRDSISLSFRARVSPCFILIRFLSRHFIAYLCKKRKKMLLTFSKIHFASIKGYRKAADFFSESHKNLKNDSKSKKEESDKHSEREAWCWYPAGKDQQERQRQKDCSQNERFVSRYRPSLSPALSFDQKVTGE